MQRIGAVILAAGESARFGSLKQLARFQGRTLLQRMVDVAKEAGCDPIIVVLGSASDNVMETLSGSESMVVVNESWQAGIGTSIRAGIRQLIDRGGAAASAVLLACDQPLVNAGII